MRNYAFRPDESSEEDDEPDDVWGEGGWGAPSVAMEDEEEMTTEEANAMLGDGVERDFRTSKGGWKRVFIFKDEEMDDEDEEDDPDAYFWFNSDGEGRDYGTQVQGNYFKWVPDEKDADDDSEYIFKETFDGDYLPYALGDDESTIEKFYKSPRDYDKEVRKIVNLIDY